MATTVPNGDINNTAATRVGVDLAVDPSYANRSFAILTSEDDPEIREKYRPFLLDNVHAEQDWIAKLELSTVFKMVEQQVIRGEGGGGRLKVLVLYGSMRNRSFSRLAAYEASRILWRLGCDVRVYDPRDLPLKDDVQHDHPKVQELRDLSQWSDGHVWISPEQHGNLTAVFKNQIDWIPLSASSMCSTQGRTLAIVQVNDDSQSFNAVNSLRMLGCWIGMFTIPNQSSIPMAHTHFTDPEAPEGGNRMKPSSNRDRLVDCMEEFVKYTLVMRPHFDVFRDKFSEREEKRVQEEERQAAALREKVAALLRSM